MTDEPHVPLEKRDPGPVEPDEEEKDAARDAVLPGVDVLADRHGRRGRAVGWLNPSWAATVIGPAVIGYDPVQHLAWKPCCGQPIRLDGTQAERWMPVVILCDRPRCQVIWTVEFPEPTPGDEATAVWRVQLHKPLPEAEP